MRKIKRIELTVFAIIILLCNLHLFTNSFPENTALFPDKLFAGEWWRIFTHFFAHLSWYHLLIDSEAFLILFFSINEKKRYMYLTACAIGSLIFPLLFSKMIYSNGLCGLSGMAHGLMIIAALEMIENKQTKTIGWIALSAVIIKTTIELTVSPEALLFLHLGNVGIPVAECHAGGIIGGLITFYFLECSNKGSRKNLTNRRDIYCVVAKATKKIATKAPRFTRGYIVALQNNRKRHFLSIES